MALCGYYVVRSVKRVAIERLRQSVNLWLMSFVSSDLRPLLRPIA